MLHQSGPLGDFCRKSLFSERTEMAELLRLMFHDSYHRRSSHDTVLWLPTTDSYQNAKTTTLSCVTFVLFIKPYYIIFNYILIKVDLFCVR